VGTASGTTAWPAVCDGEILMAGSAGLKAGRLPFSGPEARRKAQAITGLPTPIPVVRVSENARLLKS
jgi:hypothetical protein